MNETTGQSNQGALQSSVDGCVDGVVKGWAWSPENPGLEASVQLSSQGITVAAGVANRFRQDLLDAGLRGGYCAFLIGLPASVQEGAHLEVHVITDAGPVAAGLPIIVTHKPSQAATFPVPIVAPAIVGFIEILGARGRFRGWAVRSDGSADYVKLSVYEGDTCLMSIDSTRWRNDLADLREGNGSCGFDAPIPVEFCDGLLHELDVRETRTGRSILPSPMVVQLQRSDGGAWLTGPATKKALQRVATGVPCELSIIVNFYNMQREAERTLTSLTRGYQQGSGDLDYEVLCIDNGSDPPMDAAWVSGFGPEFRLIRPERILGSPCAAINAAACEARGRHVAIMIDGAHVMTPGVLAESHSVIGAEPDAIVALRQWFIGGDQRWLSEVGYSREMEDQLFDRIHWPTDGYQLFKIGAPMGEQPDNWLDDMYETNCLILPTDFYCAMGGMDEDFSEPGAGFANLDLFRRATLSSTGSTYCLVGEASFHQYHGGTTTNVSDQEKDRRVRQYSNAYKKLRGEEFVGVDTSQLKLRGSIRDKSAISIRQKTMLPMGIGVTGRVRPGNMRQHYGEGARTYLQSVYAECALHSTTTWQGSPVAMAPVDLLNLQELVCRLRPDTIVVTGEQRGLVGFLHNVLDGLSLHSTRIVQVVPANHVGAGAAGERTSVVQGAIDGTTTLASVRRLLGCAECTLVLFLPVQGEPEKVAAHLRAYSEFVSHRSYLVFIGSVFGQPWLGYSSNWYLAGIKRFLSDGGFTVDRAMERGMVTLCPSGYLQRINGRMSLATYDGSLDNVEALIG